MSGRGPQAVGDLEGEYASHERLRKLQKLLRLSRTALFRRGLRHRVAAAIEHQDVPFQYQFATVMDIGAHHGQFALFALERFPHARIYCFEPLPQARGMIRQVLRSSDPVELFDVALGDRSDPNHLMHVSHMDDSSSLLPITKRYTTAFSGTEELNTTSVSVARLDDVFPDGAPRPCLIKIDVQGFELNVLKGGERLLGSVDELLIECSFVELYGDQALASEVIAFLYAVSFTLTGVFGVKRDKAGRCLQADLLFTRTNRRSADR